MSEKISIIGGGSWGTALAQHLARNHCQVLIYMRDERLKNIINDTHINVNYFPEITLSKNIKATVDLLQVLDYAKILILAVPTSTTRIIMQKITDKLSNSHIIISTAKGIEEETHLSNFEIIKKHVNNRVAVLSGPTHAEEVIQGLPTAAVIATDEQKLAEKIRDLFMDSYLRIYTNIDITGVELGGAVKNVIAIAAGISDGLKYGDNSRAALITRGLSEISRFGTYLGGKPLTFAGLAGMGDLVVTCCSMHSRNRRFGIKIGHGLSLDEARKAINQTIEGINTTRALYKWVYEESKELELPITNQIYQVLFKAKDPRQAVEDLMLRGPKQELIDFQ